MTNDADVTARFAEALLHAVLGNTDGGLVLDGDLPASEIARLIREEALPVMREYGDQRAAEALRDFADLIDRGPTFPLPPGIFSAMARERANDLRGAGE